MIKGKQVAAIVTAAVLIATPLIGQWEGKRNDPYKDIAGVTTVCYGETRVTMRSYSDAECLAMLDKAVQGFAEPVLRATPVLADKPYALAAATSLSYNIGIGAYNGSTARKRFNQGDIAGGCSALTFWDKARVKGKLQTVKGLQNRRKAEYQLCIKDL
jgi:lysozyme